MSKYIIIEGTDRVGKTTQVAKLIQNLNQFIFHKVHYSSLPFDDLKKIKDYSLRLYNDMFRMMISLNDTNINLIFDRSHLGESVYAPLYRGYSGDYVFNLEKEYIDKIIDDVYLITLINDPAIIMNRDDGNSFYKNEEEVKAEIDGFSRAHRLSLIKNKLLVNVGNMTPDDVSNIILNFIES